MIEIKSLRKSYKLSDQTDIQVLNGIDLQVDTGKTLAITGISGSGKTTFLSLIAGLDHVTSGEIVINQHPIHQMGEAELTHFRARNIGFIFQNFYLLPHLTALENVCLPLDILGKTNSVEQAKTLIDKVGLGHRMNLLPAKLSGGECQRIAIARAIVTQPALILADEPTGNLDVDTGLKISQLLFDLVSEHQLTMIIVTHNPDLAGQCDRHLQLLYGQLG